MGSPAGPAIHECAHTSKDVKHSKERYKRLQWGAFTSSLTVGSDTSSDSIFSSGPIKRPKKESRKLSFLLDEAIYGPAVFPESIVQATDDFGCNGLLGRLHLTISTQKDLRSKLRHLSSAPLT